MRRDGEQRASKTLDDIVTIMSCLDEKLKLSCLPKFVAESPDSMPSLRVYDGNLWTLMAAFDKLKEHMFATEATLAAILQAVNSSRDMVLTRPVRDAVEATTSVDNARAQLAPKSRAVSAGWCRSGAKREFNAGKSQREISRRESSMGSNS